MKNKKTIELTQVCIEYDLGSFLKPKTFKRNRSLDKKIKVNVDAIQEYSRVNPINKKIGLKDRIFKPSNFINLDLDPYTNISLNDNTYLKVKETPEEIRDLLDKTSISNENTNDLYWTFIEKNHFKPKLDERLFFSLKGMDFGWFILEPLSLYIENESNEATLGKNLSYGQKSIYFWWYIDGQVTNGGFFQFFLNGYDKYLSVIIKGLRYIGDDEMSDFLEIVEDFYYNNNTGALESISIPEEYKSIVSKGEAARFTILEAKYLSLNDSTISKIENYAKSNPSEFCLNLKGEELQKTTTNNT
ncbi:DMP19 family protein [Tenacibaculum ovolyticum]|uniref:DMP19 family protein n=1 Tax=Tenacibaculum ovolyticum TaxID=104270 RepID=UPI0007ECAB8D|nr:DUF4375 domain-containing protein [Tenacibaculum ovolyticum]